MSTEHIDNLEEQISDLDDKLESLQYELDQSEAYGWDLAEAVTQAVHDLELIGEVPLSDVESSVLLIVETLKAAR